MSAEKEIFEYSLFCETISMAGWINLDTVSMSLFEVAAEGRLIEIVDVLLMEEGVLSLAS